MHHFRLLLGPRDAKNMQYSTVRDTISLNVHISTCECAAGSPTTATTAVREHFCTELALLVGRGAHKTHKTRSRALSAGQSHHMGLYAHICTSKCATGCPTPHVWLWSHGVLWPDRQASMCSTAACYPICQRPLSDAGRARAAQHCQPHAT